MTMDNGITLEQYLRVMDDNTRKIRDHFVEVVSSLKGMAEHTKRMREEIDRIDRLREVPLEVTTPKPTTPKPTTPKPTKRPRKKNK